MEEYCLTGQSPQQAVVPMEEEEEEEDEEEEEEEEEDLERRADRKALRYTVFSSSLLSRPTQVLIHVSSSAPYTRAHSVYVPLQM
jgi:hypothetical protein